MTLFIVFDLFDKIQEPVVVDFDNDGFAEVVFGTWPENTAGTWGSLTILNYQGVLLDLI